MIRYRAPVGVRPDRIRGRPVLFTAQGGAVLVDAVELRLWQAAQGRCLDEILPQWVAAGDDPALVRASLACLAEAGLLERQAPGSRGTQAGPARTPVDSPPDQKSTQSALRVSAIVVGHNSRPWLAPLFDSLSAQTHPLLETILVDNASGDGTAEWTAQAHPTTHLVRLDDPQSLAHAINLGVSAASGDAYLLLNPDVVLEAGAIARMVEIADGDPACAAVAAKLRFLWAPAFLNGLGNFVGPFWWGTDCALGHLDLGQFDAWEEVPSACFAAALIPAAAWQAAGPLDEGFPMYYEDTEWCYRARLFGFRVRAAPLAIVYHAFGSRTPGASELGMRADRLRRILHGRLRFAWKLLRMPYLLRFFTSYVLEDSLNLGAALLRLRFPAARAYLEAWRDFFGSLPELRRQRRSLQSRQKIADRDLFALQRSLPPPLIWRGLPQLTWDVVEYTYAPFLACGRGDPAPEYAEGVATAPGRRRRWLAPPALMRVGSIYRAQGLRGLLHFLWRQLQRRLMQP